MNKLEIKKALQYIYTRLNRTDDLRAEINLSDGSLVCGTKQFQRRGRFAWKPLFSFTRFDGAYSGWNWTTISEATNGIFKMNTEEK